MGNRLHSVTKQHRPTVLLYTTLKASKSVGIRMCVQVRVREKRERETDADKTLESLIYIYIYCMLGYGKR